MFYLEQVETTQLTNVFLQTLRCVVKSAWVFLTIPCGSSSGHRSEMSSSRDLPSYSRHHLIPEYPNLVFRLAAPPHRLLPHPSPRPLHFGCLVLERLHDGQSLATSLQNGAALSQNAKLWCYFYSCLSSSYGASHLRSCGDAVQSIL